MKETVRADAMPDYDRERLKQLERFLTAFDKVVFFPCAAEYALIQAGLEQGRVSDKKILFIAPDSCALKHEDGFVKSISMEDAETLLRLYYTYEFADNFLVVTEESPFAANIFHFVATGVLSYEEAWLALLY